MKISANAKINLTLEVLGTRPDGYHALKSIVIAVSLADEIEIEPAEEISSDTGYADDLCIKAAKAILPSGKGTKIHVEKRIPAGGGLGGGSADAAAVLRALNEMYALGYAPEALAEIGARVGSDVPALVLAQHYRRPVMMEGRGEIVSPMDAVPSRALVLANPGVFSSTPEVFREWKANSAINQLEPAAIALHPEIGRAIALLAELGAAEARMTGSGATVFGFARDEREAARIAAAMRERGFLAWEGRTYGGLD